ncbi:MAG: hypothetical protein V1808_00855 [Candidatus Daviesbacteria bacterium]
MIYRKIYFRRYLAVLRNKRLIILGVIIIMALFAIFTLKNILLANKENKTQNDSRISFPEAKAKKDINKNFSFPLKNQKGEEVSRIEYTVLNASLQDQIVSKGKSYTTVKGRTILILNLKITNKHNQSIEINSRDYVRLSVNGNTELLAADIHNDPVLIQAISTKYTRLGFPIYDTDKNLKILVGEIGDTKEEVTISF